MLNRLRDELRRKARTPDVTDLEGVENVAALSPLEDAIGREAVEDYERALERLSQQDRETIIARIEIGYTYEELAVALGKPSADAARKSASRAPLRLAAESWFLLAAGTGCAQTPFGTITGTTKDPAGAVLAGVQVTITHRETRQSRLTF